MRKNESVEKYYESVNEKQDRDFAKVTKEFIEGRLAEMDDKNAEYQIMSLRHELLGEYFDCEFELEPLEKAKTIEEARRWYESINWEWFSKPLAGYFRKVNSVYNYFSDRLENEMCEVYKSDLITLIHTATDVLSQRDEGFSYAKLPTQGGFFFGGTDYDKAYYTYQVKKIITECAEMLDKWTDDKDRMFVIMSW